MAKAEEHYKKPTPAKGLPKWYLDIRAGSEFMPSKIKPVSYNFMAGAESPNRKVIYGASNPSVEPGRYPLSATGKTGPISNTPMLHTSLGTYYAPTKDVATKVQKNFSILQSIKSLGGEIKERAGSMLHIFDNVLSRPRYAVMNAYKENMEYWYKGEKSAGGARVTGGEQLANIATTFTPLSIIRNIGAGRLDDDLANLWKGFSGQKTTGMREILASQTPGFVKEHPKIAGVGAAIGDVVLDPVNLISVAAVPGSVVRGVGSAGLRLAGRKESALKLFDETFFSKPGRTAALNTLRKDIIQKDANKIQRQIGKVQKDANRKKPKMEATVRIQKEKELRTALTTKMNEDLKGADFAWRVLRKSIPTLGMGTVSRLSIAAAASGTAMAGARTLKAAHAAATADTVEDLMKEEYWNRAYENLKGEDIEYEHADTKYKVDLKDKADFKSWLTRVVEEAAPLAAYNESSAKAARSRGGRNIATETRGKKFMTAYNQKVDDAITKDLNPTQKEQYLFGMGAKSVAAKAKVKTKVLTRAEAEKKGLHIVDEADLNNHSFDALKKASQDAWKKGGGKGRKTDRAQIVIKYEDGTYHRVSLSALRTHAENASDAAAGRLLDEARLAERTPRQEAVDRITGVTDGAARRRDRLLDIARKRENVVATNRAAQATMAAASAATGAVAADSGAARIENALRNVIGKSPEFTDEERASLAAMLGDPNMTQAERVSAVMNSDLIDDSTALAQVREVFQTVIKDDTVMASEGGGLSGAAEIFQNVISNRWGERVTPAMSEASGIDFNQISRQLEMAKKVEDADPNYLRDIHGEIGMMLMDAYKFALDYAVKQEMLEDPAKMFAAFDGPMQDFINQASAETKSQVMQLMYNLTGMRLPEDFVPTHAQIDNIKNFKFMKADGKTPLDQEVVHQNLVTVMQDWVKQLFPDIPVERYVTPSGVNAKTGYKMDELGIAIINRAKKRKVYVPPIVGKPTPAELAHEKVSKLRAEIDALQGEIIKAGDGTLNGDVAAVNRYSMLDFIMHSKEIVKSQKVSLVANPAGGKNRIQMGRLSALDSFTFASDEAQKGLKAIDNLRAMTRSADPKAAELAKAELAHLFLDNGGARYLMEVRMPPTHNLADVDITAPLKRLGTHARLKEEAISKTEPFGRKLRADLMDELWGSQSLVHEWQKAFQNKILHDVYIKGMTREQSAKKLAENLDNAFAKHENVKALLYPAKRNAPSGALRGVESMPGKPVAANLTPDSPEILKVAEAREARAGHVAAKAKAGEAVTDYMSSLKSDEPMDIPTTGTADDVTPLNDNPDFGNIDANGAPKLNDVDRQSIVDWVSKTYANSPPEAVVTELRSISIAMSMDLLEAQARLQTHASDLSFKHGRRVRFAGIPLVPAKGPVNMTHSLAAVTAMDTQRAFATRFFGGRFKRVPALDQPDLTRAQAIARKYTRQSQVLEGSLDRIRMGVVNASSQERKVFIRWINDLYKTKISKGEFHNTNVQNMNPRQRADYLSKAFFDPNYGKTPDMLDEFKTVDGDNPARVIESNMADISHEVFGDVDPSKYKDVIKTFNRHMSKKFRLTPQQIENLHMYVDHNQIAPYTREWFIAVGKMEASKFGNMDTGNIAELHYAMQDAKLKIRAGRDLQDGVFEEFSFQMRSEVVDFHNNELGRRAVGASGEPMRGDIVNIKKLVDDSIIDAKYVPSEYMQGDRYINMDMIPHIKTMFDYMDEVGDLVDTLNVEFMQKILNHFKASVTIYKIPTYPVKNTISDVFMGAMDGLTNPRYYKMAAEIINGNHQAMKEVNLQDYQRIIDQDFVKSSLAKAAHDPESVKAIDDIAPNMRTRLLLMTEGGEVKLNDAQIMHIYDQLGLGQNRVVGEFAESVAAVRQTKAGKSAGAAHDIVKNFNDVREDWARVAHFVFAMEEEATLGGSLDDIAIRAADRVMKYHFDYGDVSLWERGRVAKHIPFYKWVKNIIPFTITSMITTPRYINIEQGINEAVGTMVNDDPEDMGFKDFVLPEYIQRENSVPIGWFMNNNGNKFNQYMMLNFPLSETVSKTLAPTIDPWINGEFEGFANKLEESGRGAFTTGLSMTHPGIKAVLQGAYHQTLWPTGAAPEKPGESWMETLSAVIPGWPALKDIGKNVTPNEKEAGYTGFNKTGKILEVAGAANVNNNTESAQIGSLMTTEDRLTGQLKKRKAIIAERAMKKFPQLTREQADQLVTEYLKETKSG